MVAKTPPAEALSKRERQIMDIVFRLGEASATEVTRLMPEEAGYDSVRVTLRNLEKKGHLTHHRDGRQHLYRPTISRKRATNTAVSNLVKTFFAGSTSKAILTMLDLSSAKLTSAELREIEEWVEQEKRAT